jgi:hypothetical protein
MARKIKVSFIFSVVEFHGDINYELNYLERNGVTVSISDPVYDPEIFLEGPSDVIVDFVEDFYEKTFGENISFRELIFDPRLGFYINGVNCVEDYDDEDDLDSVVKNPKALEIVNSFLI